MPWPPGSRRRADRSQDVCPDTRHVTVLTRSTRLISADIFGLALYPFATTTQHWICPANELRHCSDRCRAREAASAARCRGCESQSCRRAGGAGGGKDLDWVHAEEGCVRANNGIQEPRRLTSQTRSKRRSCPRSRSSQCLRVLLRYSTNPEPRNRSCRTYPPAQRPDRPAWAELLQHCARPRRLPFEHLQLYFHQEVKMCPAHP